MSVMNVNRTMLRFRPIAPKPSSGGVEVPESKNLTVLRPRTKRKYVRVRRNSGYRRPRSKKDSPGQGQGQGQDDGSGREIVTLQLLPEKKDRVVEMEEEEGEGEEEEERWWCSIDGTVKSRVGLGTGPPTWTVGSEGCGATDLTGHREDETRVVESWVTVECVTDTCNNTAEGHVPRGMGVGTEVDRAREILEEDTCPGMISDGLNWRVEWVNGAYRRMVRQGNDRQLRVGLVVRERLPSVSEFSCRVRVQYYYTNRRIVNRDQWLQIVVPCDVWRINGGGFAWRLDIEAALSLGR